MMFFLGMMGSLLQAEPTYVRGQELPAYNVNLFHASIDGKQVFLNEESTILYLNRPWARLNIRAQGPALSYIPYERDEVDLVGGFGGFDLVVGYATKKIGKPLRVAVLVPVYLGANQDNPAALGDLHLDVKCSVLSRSWDGHGLALSAKVFAPTGPKSSALSDESVQFGFNVIYDTQKILQKGTLHLNVGYRTQPETLYENFRWGSHMNTGAGISVPVSLNLEQLNIGSDFSTGFSGEVMAKTHLERPFSTDSMIAEASFGGWFGGQLNGIATPILLRAAYVTSLTTTPGSTGFRIIVDGSYKF